MGFPALFYYLEKVWKHLHKICMSRELEYPPQTPVPALLTPCPGPAPWTLSHQGGIPAQPPCFTPGRTLAHQVFPAQKDCLNHESPINTCPGFRAVQCCSVCSSHPAQTSLSLGSCKCLIPSSSSSLGPAQRRTLLDDVVIFPEAKQVVQSSGWINSPWKFYVSLGLEAAALSRVSPGMRWLHPAFPAGNNQAISLGFPLLRTTHWTFCCEAGLSLVLWGWERGLKEQRQTCSSPDGRWIFPSVPRPWEESRKSRCISFQEQSSK